MIKQLGNWDIYQSRVSCCFLLNSCYPHISSTQQLELRQLFSELARDDTPMVRRAVAANLSSFGSVIEKTLIKSELLPLWQLLIKDDIDSVKIKAIESSNFFVSNLRKDEANNAMITLLKNIDNEKKSWRVRYALAEVLPSMLGSLDKETILKEIVDIYENFMKDTEPEVKSIAALKFPEIAEKMNEKMIIDRIIPILKNLAEDTNQHVRHALAQILVKIAKFLDVRNIIEYFVPIITQIYKDEFLDVRLALIETFGYIINN